METQTLPVDPTPPAPKKFPTIAKAMLECQIEIKNATKDRENSHFKNVYATLESVLEAVKETASKHSILIVQTTDRDEKGSYILTTRLIHDSGEQIETKIHLLLDKQNMQALGSAITYARRYSIAALFCIGQEDDDGNAASAGKNGADQNRGNGAQNQGNLQGQNGGNNSQKPRPTPTPGANGGYTPGFAGTPQGNMGVTQANQNGGARTYQPWKGEPGAFLIPVGQRKGLTIKSQGLEYHAQLVEWIRMQADVAKLPIPHHYQDYITNVQKFSDQVNSPDPSLQKQDDIPTFDTTGAP
jgi:hypothetical protein